MEDLGGNRSLRVPEDQGGQQFAAALIIEQFGDERRGLLSPEGQVIARVVEHNRPQVNWTDDVELQLLVKCGNGDLPRLEGIWPNTEDGEPGPISVNRTSAIVELLAVCAKVGPRHRRARCDYRSVFTGPPLRDQ